MKRVDIIFGTRPELIKLYPLISLLRRRSGYDLRVICSGQHREMLTSLFEWFQFEPDYDLAIMKNNSGLSNLTVAALGSISEFFDSNGKPELLLVQGDTTTAFAAALAAFYHNILVGHIEAGLRTFDNHSPWPEEINRVFISKLSDWHFAPTMVNQENLVKEGIQPDKVFVTGNTVIDALTYSVDRIAREGIFPAQLASYFVGPLKDMKIVLITGHRRENFGKGLEAVCEAVRILRRSHPDVHFIYPVHLNPNVSGPVRQLLGDLEGIRLIEPLPYPEFVSLMLRSALIITDSGGIQEEAPTLGKTVLVTRKNTERPETEAAGYAILVGTETNLIVNTVKQHLSGREVSQERRAVTNPYGDGTAGQRIVDILDRLQWKGV